MSLKPQPARSMPSDIAAWGAKHLAADNLYNYVGDTLYAQLPEADFADLYHAEGKPAISPVVLALVSVFQHLERLSDQGAVTAVQMRLDWKYALRLSIDADAFDASVLSEFRTRLVDHQAEDRVFARILCHLKERGLLKQRGTQRTDSTHVLAAIRALNRLETIGEALRAALNTVAVVAPVWLQAFAPQEWVKRYGPHFAEWQLPQAQAKRDALVLQIGQDGAQFLRRVYAADAPQELRNLPAVDVLRQIWVQQYAMEDGHLRWRRPDELPPATRAINSPHDAAARYSSKRSTIWVGYKVHLSETCDADMPRLITNVELTPAPIADTDMTATIHDHLAENDQLPANHLLDAGYIDAEHLVESEQQHQITLVGPVPIDPGWQARAENGFGAANFQFDWSAEVATCPQGQKSTRWKPSHDGNGNATISVEFPKAVCRVCPVQSKCTKSEQRGRQLNIRRQAHHEALITARERQKTESFREQYRMRAGIEGTLSQGVRRCGMRRSRYRGETKTRLQEVFGATALNLQRAVEWLAGHRPVQTRSSPLVKLLNSAAAT